MPTATWWGPEAERGSRDGGASRRCAPVPRPSGGGCGRSPAGLARAVGGANRVAADEGHQQRSCPAQPARHPHSRVPPEPSGDGGAVGPGGGADGAGPHHRRPALRRPAPQAGQDARARAHRVPDRPRHALPRADAPGGGRDRGPDRRRHHLRHRDHRGRGVHDRRHRHDLPGRLGQPPHRHQGLPGLRDRPAEPPALHQLERGRRRRAATPGRHLRAGRRAVPSPHPAFAPGYPDHHPRLRSCHRRRGVRPGHERLRGDGRRTGPSPIWAARRW